MKLARSVAFTLTLLAVASAGGEVSASSVVTVSGSVIGGAQTLKDAEVRVLVTTSNEPRQAIVRARTDSRGRFTLTVPWSGEGSVPGELMLAIEASGFAPRLVDLWRPISGLPPGGRTQLGGLMLDAGCALTGRVVASAGGITAPATDARVVLWHEDYDKPWQSETDDEGRVRFAGLPPGRFVLGASSPGRLSTRRELKVRCVLDESVGTLELTAGEPLAVKALLEDGRPASGARYLSVPLPPEGVPSDWIEGATGVADASGRFSVPVGVRESRWLVRILHPEALPGGARWHKPSEPPQQPLVLTLRAVHRIRGEVVDTEGDGIAGVVVSVAPQASRATSREVATDRYGLFDSGALPPGGYTLAFKGEGYEPSQQAVEIAETSHWPTRVRARLRPLDSIEGGFRVVDHRERPLRGAEVSVLSLVTMSHGKCFVAEGGQCSIEGLPADERVWVSVAHPAYDEYSTVVARIDPEEVLVVALPEPSWQLLTVRGLVRGADGRPVAGAALSLVEPYRHTSLERGSRTAADGSFALLNVPEGGYVLEVTAAGYAQSLLPVEVTPGREPIELELRRGATVRGRLLGWADQEVEVHGGVDVRRQRGETADPCTLTFYGVRGLPAPEGGRIDGDEYRVGNLPPGDWVLSTGSFPSWKGRVRVTEADLGEELLLDLRPPDPVDCVAQRRARAKSPENPSIQGGNNSLEYSIAYRSGILAPDCLTLELVDERGDVVAALDCADARGVWRGLPSGDFRLRSGPSESWSVTLPSAARRFELAPTGGLTLRIPALEARFVHPTTWLRGLRVELEAVSGRDRRTIAATERLDFYGLREGWWEVRVSTAEGRSWKALVEIVEHQQRTLLLR